MGRVLVIGSDEGLAKALRDSPALQGHTVDACRGALEALKEARFRPLDVVVTDSARPVSGAMALVEYHAGGPLRFASNMLLWVITSWFTLRYGLTREDRLALGGLSRVPQQIAGVSVHKRACARRRCGRGGTGFRGCLP